jgi:hypothetical protein
MKKIIAFLLLGFALFAAGYDGRCLCVWQKRPTQRPS